MAQPFILSSTFQPVRGFSLGAYHPYSIRAADGERQKNPKFDRHSRHVLNVKQPSRSDFSEAVSYCSMLLVQFLNSQQFEQAEFVIIPSSQQGQISAGLVRVVENACRADRRVSNAAGTLHRHRTIEKLATGGDRSLDVHLNSMAYTARGRSPQLKFVLDDIMTTGNSLAAAVTVMNQVVQRGVYVPVVLGKTTHD